MPQDVLSVGLVVADHVCAPVDHLPAAGELVTTSDMILSIGGGASNVAVDLRKMNCSVAIAAAVGDDAFGRIVRDMLAEQGVDVSHLRVLPSRPTSQTLIVNVRGQDRRFIHLIGAYGEYRAEDIPLEAARQAKVLYVGYFLLMPALTAEGLIPVFEEVRRAGVRVVVDIAIGGPGDHAAKLERLLPYVDVFTPNQDEAAVILGERDPVKQAEAFHRMGAGTAIITMGQNGSVLVSRDVRLKAGSYPVEFVDGSGGGDAFCAGYIYGLIKRLPPEECLKIASALGASCVRAIGTTPGVFTEAECLDFLRRHTLPLERF
ncbi:MAG: carbohydrate kinase family protein [Gemmatales bacterium]|nr:carbohydrate kinase family protein [Gemmatales bacterium]MDW8385547.1 carbohydrate kinase family protein [Gemmatales bacterium]